MLRRLKNGKVDVSGKIINNYFNCRGEHVLEFADGTIIFFARSKAGLISGGWKTLELSERTLDKIARSLSLG
jgi:hypothetical protein